MTRKWTYECDEKLPEMLLLRDRYVICEKISVVCDIVWRNFIYGIFRIE